MTDNRPSSSEDDKPKRFRITRKRLGTIRFVDPKGEYGFIDAEDFRDDVFFHYTSLQPASVTEQTVTGSEPERQNDSQRAHNERSRSERTRDNRARDGRPRNREKNLIAADLVGRHVEFEIDDQLFETEQRLRATIVQQTNRPMGRRMTGRDATFKIVTHHPKARKKRPDWRK